eukprot:jgi/Antlo1/625/1588
MLSTVHMYPKTETLNSDASPVYELANINANETHEPAETLLPKMYISRTALSTMLPFFRRVNMDTGRYSTPREPVYIISARQVESGSHWKSVLMRITWKWRIPSIRHAIIIAEMTADCDARNMKGACIFSTDKAYLFIVVVATELARYTNATVAFSRRTFDIILNKSLILRDYVTLSFHT